MNKSTEKHRHHRSRNEYDFYGDLDNIKDAVFDATQHARGRATDFIADSMQDMKSKSTDFKDNLENYITEKPFKSIGIALLTGMVFGFLWRRK